MDDGGRSSNGGLNLHTDSYTSDEVDLLIKVLYTNFHIVGGKYLKREGQWIISISKSELDKMTKLVESYVHPSWRLVI